MSQASLDKLVGQLIGLADASDVVGISKARLHLIVKEGRLSSAFVGSCMVLLRSEVEKFAATERIVGRPTKTKKRAAKRSTAQPPE